MAQKGALLILLAAVAGATDVIGYRTLAHVFTAHMTGNTVKAASAFFDGDYAHALKHAFPIPVFVVGSFTGALIGKALRSHVVIVALETAVLVAFMLLAWPPLHGARAWLACAAPAFAMGVQAVTFRRWGNTTIQTTFITGMLVAVADSVAKWALSRGSGARARIATGIWCGYVIGAMVGAFAHVKLAQLAPLVPILGLAVALALVAPRPT